MFEQIAKIGIIPVINIDDPKKAVMLAKALLAGNIPCVEITFRTLAAEESIKRIRDAEPEVLLGAGTVLTIEQVDKAIAAGAKFIMSPGYNPRIVSYALDRNIIIIPGCSTPSDMEMAIEAGITTVKFFPAEQMGGIEYIKAVSAPYSMLSFLPTGGINIKNLAGYLSIKKVAACGGSWMATAEMIKNADFEKITALSKEASLLAANIIAAKTDMH